MAKKILVVGGDASQRRVVYGIVEPLGTIYEAANGKDALRLVAAEKPELMLLDAEIPDFAGLSIVTAARFLDPGLPILLLTGAGFAETDPRILDDGIRARIAKPIDPEGLRDEIRRAFVGKV